MRGDGCCALYLLLLCVCPTISALQSANRSCGPPCRDFEGALKLVRAQSRCPLLGAPRRWERGESSFGGRCLGTFRHLPANHRLLSADGG